MKDDRGAYRGPLSEDVEFRVTSPDDTFALTSASPVDFYEVTDGTRVVGLLWVSDDPPAAGFESLKEAGSLGMNAGVGWYRELRRAASMGMSPSEAVASFITETDLGEFGRVDAMTKTAAASSVAVERLASTMP